MKTTKRSEAERILKAPGAIRCFLLYGPDEAGSRSLVKAFAATRGEQSERVDLSGADLKGDPARLADEAAAMSMFGSDRWVLVEPAGDESVAAVEALLEAQAAGNPVLLVAGDLKASSKLLKLVSPARNAWAIASYAPDARDADRYVIERGRSLGLSMRPDVAHRIAGSCAGNRTIVDQELTKLALYLDASPETPRPLDHEAIDAVGAGADEGDLSRLAASVADGDAESLEVELARLRAEGVEGIGLTRPVLRRFFLLARLRADVEKGRRVDDVMEAAGKMVFWKERPVVQQQVSRWRSEMLARAISRLVEAERQVMLGPAGPGVVAAEAELFAICRQAARLR